MPPKPTDPAVRLLCPAKINLHLRVGPARADGFHPLSSWMCTVGLFDTLTIQSRRDTDRRAAITLTTDSPELPCDDRNLVVRIVNAWFAEAASRGCPVESAHLVSHLAKRIPAGAGLGGGSSDAAHALLALSRHFPIEGLSGDVAALSTFAARFGSDLSFFLYGPSAACAGRGEIVRPIPPPRPRRALLVLPPIHMPTADVYRRFDAMGLGGKRDVVAEPDWAAWATLDAADLLPLLANDLEPPAFAIRPDLAALRESIEQTLGRPVRMSGSGSSLFTLFDTPGEAEVGVAALDSTTGVSTEVVELAPRVDGDCGTTATHTRNAPRI